MDMDFENDFAGSVAHVLFALAAGIGFILTFVYFLTSTGSWLAGILGAVTIGFVVAVAAGAIVTLAATPLILILNWLFARSA